MSLFKGSGVAIVTPMKDDQIDFEKLGELLDWHVESGTDAIIICGTTGEASTLEDEEHKAAIKFAVEKINKRIPVIAGTGSNSTRHAILMSEYAEEVGVDGLLLVTPYYNKATQAGLIKHFTAIADAVNVPIILYNVPGRTGVNIDPTTVFELSKHKNITAVKEASGNISQVAEIARIMPDGFKLYSGNDDMIIPLMSLKGSGVISVVANILPKETHDMVALYLEGKTTQAAELQLKLKPLIDSLFIEVNPIPVKTALNLMGKNVGGFRLPLSEMDPKNEAILKSELSKAGLL
ncbi:MAG: 4-hydroxy-tetrahydrodipicolinate synthase [Acidaminobacteraceae bacterium]